MDEFEHHQRRRFGNLLAIPRTWQFRAKLVRVSNGTSSNYSPVVSITVP